MNRITQDAYDSHGNVTEIIYPDLSTTVYGTYNSFAEPSSVTGYRKGIGYRKGVVDSPIE
jgi:hypothetical protein